MEGTIRNQRYFLCRRRGIYYCEDTQTRKQISLLTKDGAEAQTLLLARNEAARQPTLNMKPARTCLAAADPKALARTWGYLREEIIRIKTDDKQRRWKTIARPKPMDSIRNIPLIEIRAEHPLHVLQQEVEDQDAGLKNHCQVRRPGRC